MDSKNVPLHARCLCGAHTNNTEDTQTTQPHKKTNNHCTSCRHITGGLYFADVYWPTHNEDDSGLVAYDHSPNVRLFFCGTCYTILFCRSEPSDPGALSVMTGALDNAPGLVRYARHIFVGDTLDGGASVWLRWNRDGTPVRRWKERSIGPSSEELPPEWPGSAASESAAAAPELTPLRCLCGGVDLRVRAATDLDAGDLPWHVDPESRKNHASIDACDSCRLQFASDVPNWTFAQLSHLEFPGEAAGHLPLTTEDLKTATLAAPEMRDPRLGTLACYSSSANVDRYHCSLCSATKKNTDSTRPDMVDVAVGLLHHPSGARAEGLLSWNLGMASWADDAKGGWR